MNIVRDMTIVRQCTFGNRESWCQIAIYNGQEQTNLVLLNMISQSNILLVLFLILGLN